MRWLRGLTGSGFCWFFVLFCYIFLILCNVIFISWFHAVCHHFYRAMSVRLSVCPYVTRRYSVDTAEILNFFTISPTILVFPYQILWQYSDGDPHNGVSNTRAHEKNRDFLTNISLYFRNDASYSHSYYKRRICHYGTLPNLSNGAISNDLEWPLTWFQGHDITQR